MVIVKVLNVLNYGSISPNRTFKMIFEFCNLKFLRIRSNVKRVDSSALYKWFAILSRVRRADRKVLEQKDESRMIRADQKGYANQVQGELLIFVDTQYPV